MSKRDEPKTGGLWSKTVDWASKNPGASVSLLGLLLYAELRLATGIFYGVLGTTPEEVGLGYGSTLAQSIIGVAGLAVLYVALRVAWFATRFVRSTARQSRASPDAAVTTSDSRAIIPGIRIRFHRARTRLVSAGREAVSAVRQSGLATTTKGWAIIVLLLLLEVPITTYANANNAKHGYAIRAQLAGIPIWGVKAELAYVVWTNPQATAPLGIRNRACLLYLGQANGVTVLYDASGKRTLRIPSGTILVSTGGPLAELQRCPATAP